MQDFFQYSRGVDFVDHAPYRAITVQDAISDLPSIDSEEKEELAIYYGTPAYHFQKSASHNHYFHRILIILTFILNEI